MSAISCNYNIFSIQPTEFAFIESLSNIILFSLYVQRTQYIEKVELKIRFCFSHSLTMLLSLSIVKTFNLKWICVLITVNSKS